MLKEINYIKNFITNEFNILNESSIKLDIITEKLSELTLDKNDNSTDVVFYFLDSYPIFKSKKENIKIYDNCILFKKFQSFLLDNTIIIITNIDEELLIKMNMILAI